MPEIETARLYLRPLVPEDLDGMAALYADPLVTRYLGNGEPRTREMTQKNLAAHVEHWQQFGG